MRAMTPPLPYSLSLSLSLSLSRYSPLSLHTTHIACPYIKLKLESLRYPCNKATHPTSLLAPVPIFSLKFATISLTSITSSHISLPDTVPAAQPLWAWKISRRNNSADSIEQLSDEAQTDAEARSWG